MARHVTFWVVAFSVFVLDRVSKFLVQSYLPVGDSVGGVVSITHVLNTGTAFGLLKSVPWLFALFAIIVSVYIIATYSRYEKSVQFALALVLGGALGNLLDRFLYGAVVDFKAHHRSVEHQCFKWVEHLH